MARCTAYPDGAHRSEEKGYSLAHCGYLRECQCGHRLIFPTDEMLAQDPRLAALVPAPSS